MDVNKKTMSNTLIIILNKFTIIIVKVFLTIISKFHSPIRPCSTYTANSFTVQLILATIIMFPLFLTAQHDTKSLKPPADKSLLESALQNNIAISRWLDEVANEIDLFIVGKKITDRKNDTHIKIDNSSYIEERKKFNNTTSFNLNLRLPNLEDYWQLKFTSYDEGEDRRGLQNGPLRKSPREKNYGASVGFFRELGKIQTSFQPRVDLGSRLKISHSLGFSSHINYTKFEFVPKFEFYAGPTKGAGIYQSYNFNIPLNATLVLSLINNGNYEDKAHYFSTANGVALAKGVSDTSSITYSLIFGSNNRSNYHLEDYTLASSWSHVLYKKILDYQVTPYLNFPRSKNFAITPGMTFQFGLKF